MSSSSLSDADSSASHISFEDKSSNESKEVTVVNSLSNTESDDEEDSSVSRLELSSARQQSQRYLHYAMALKKIILPMIGLAILVGVASGLIVGIYMFCNDKLMNISRKLYAKLTKNLLWLPLAFAINIILGCVNGFLSYKFPEIRGSGIPYIEAVARGAINLSWYSSLPLMFINSLISIFMGLSLGGEGPSVYMGGCAGYAICSLMKLDKMHNMLLVSAGSAAGLSTAFDAPLSGLVFSIEEVYRKFSMQITVTSILTVSIAGIITHMIFKTPLLDIGTLKAENFGIIQFVIAVLAGIVGGILGAGFNILIRYSNKAYVSIPFLRPWCYPAIAGIFSVVVNVWWPDAGYTGSIVTEAAFKNQKSLLQIGLSFVIKTIYISVCFGAKASGGIFIPILAVGGLLGCFIGQLCMKCGVDEGRYEFIALMTISSFYTGVVRAPLTAAILPVEYTRQYLGWLGPITSVAFGFIVAEMLRVKPLYEALITGLKPIDELNESYKFIFCIHPDSIICGMHLRELIFPEKTIVSSIIRDNVPIVPSEDTKLIVGDEMIIEAETDNPNETESQLSILF